MPITANDPKRKTWLDTSQDTDFPIQNIPFGVFLTRDDIITIGTRIGDYAIDLGALHQLGYFEGIPLTDDIFLQDTALKLCMHTLPDNRYLIEKNRQ